jgi:integrase
MARIKLTPGRLHDFRAEKAQAFLWDTEAPGLAVRATANGAKSFVFQAKLAGRDIRLTVGDVRAWTLEDARKEARRLHNLIDQGTDPREHKRERIAIAEAKKTERRRQEVTVREAWDAYIQARRHKWSPLHLRDHERIAREGGAEKVRGTGTLVDGPLAALMPLKLSELTPAKVEAWLREETAHRPTFAALAYRLLRAFIRWSAGHDDFKTAANPEAVGSRVAKDHVPRAKAREGDCLQREQLAPWFKAVRELGNPVIAAYLQALVLTGARREEMAGLRWADVEFQWKSLTIRDKVEGERVIPLTPYLASLLAALPRRNQFVFSSPTAERGHLREPRAAHTRALAAAGLPHVSLHGLRRSFGTLSEWVECPVGIVAQIMGHKPSAIAERHYRRRPLDLLRLWHSRIEAWILEQAGIEQSKEGQEGLRVVKS